jgi:hypothetical protein
MPGSRQRDADGRHAAARRVPVIVQRGCALCTTPAFARSSVNCVTSKALISFMLTRLGWSEGGPDDFRKINHTAGSENAENHSPLVIQNRLRRIGLPIGGHQPPQPPGELVASDCVYWSERRRVACRALATVRPAASSCRARSMDAPCADWREPEPKQRAAAKPMQSFGRYRSSPAWA